MEDFKEFPAPLCGDIPGTWAHKTISYRFPRIAQRVIEENAYSDQINLRINQLIGDIPNNPIRLIDDPGAIDIEDWKAYVLPHVGSNWFNPPWWFTEHYFYRRILEATSYFHSGDGGGLDPFRYQKLLGLKVNRSSIHEMCHLVMDFISNNLDQETAFFRLLTFDLWGNQADLSLWGADDYEKPDHINPLEANAHILVDDRLRVLKAVTTHDSNFRIDFLIDNAGFELVVDLILSSYLLQSGLAERVRSHVKPHPTYVSDATQKDVLDTLVFLDSEKDPETQRLGRGLLTAIDHGKLDIQTNRFWVSPLAGWDMPLDLRDDLAQAHLVISKGDAHYRRILGDRNWTYDVPFEKIMSYYPSPIVALRTLKSELIVGLRPGQAEIIQRQDPEWMVNGRWGLVQYSPRYIDHSKI